MVRAIGSVVSIPHSSSSLLHLDKVNLRSLYSIGYRSRKLSTICSSSSPSSARAPSSASASASNGKAKKKEDRVQMISSRQQFDAMLRDAKDKLVVVEYAASHSQNSKRIYPAMVELSTTCPETVFGLILADESEETKEMFKQAGVENVPHFIFYKSMEVVHEEEALTHSVTQDLLLGDVLYYGDAGSSSAGVEQLHSRADVEASIAKHKLDGQLLVLDVGLKHCGPCVKVYPTVLKLAKKLAGSVVFARMHGDENDDCMDMLKELGVIEVPTFLFIKDGVVQGRYVGSGRGELIGEILRHQGVRVTY